MNTTQFTKTEQDALNLMLEEAIRERNKGLFRKLVDGSEEELEALLDQFFR